MSETYTVKQVAELLGYSTNSIYTFLKQGRIKGIRVGQGRFRITEEELRRVLHLSKKPVSLDKEPVTDSDDQISAQIKEIDLKISGVHFTITSLFSWFAATVSIVLGFSLFLYNKDYSQQKILNWLFLVSPIRIGLISGGAGMIITDYFSKKISRWWSQVFRLVLIFSYFLLTSGKFYLNNVEGAIIYAVMVLVLGLNWFKLAEGLDGFLVLFTLNGLLIPISAFFYPETVDFHRGISFIGDKQPVFLGGLVIIVIVGQGLLWWSHLKKRLHFWVIMFLFGAISILVSLSFVSLLAWDKAFFSLVTGLTCFLVPAWESLRLQDHRERKIILPIFSGVLILLLLIIGSIYLMEQNIKDYATGQLTGKLNSGRVLVESTLQSIEKMAVANHRNPLLVEAVKDKDEKKITELLKIIFSGGETVRRLRTILLLSTTGDLLGIYPYELSTEKNFAFRDYFKTAVEGQIFISDSFEAKLADRRKVVTVSGPIDDTNGKTVAVLVASIDLVSLGDRLQKTTKEDNGEYFVVVDKNDRYITHPDRELIGQPVGKDDYRTNFLQEQEYPQETFNNDGDRVIQQAATINPTGWLIAIQAPMVKLLRPTRTVSAGIFSVTALLVIATGIYLVYLQIRKI